MIEKYPQIVGDLANYKEIGNEIVESLIREELWKNNREDILNESLKKVVDGNTSPYQVAESLFNDFIKKV